MKIGLHFDLDLNIDMDYLLIKGHLPTLSFKLLEQCVLDLSVAQGVGDQHDV